MAFAPASLILANNYLPLNEALYANVISKGVVPNMGSISVVTIVFVFLFIVPAILQWLWNITIPELFNLNKIRYWQAFRLIIICKILFVTTSASLPM